MAKKSKKKFNPGAIQLSKAERLAQAEKSAKEQKSISDEKEKKLPKEEIKSEEISLENKAEETKIEKQSITEVKTTKKDQKTKKEKKPNRLVRKFKETGSELKKVAWPSFSKVVKQTGVVLAVVLIFTIVIFGIDWVLSELFKLLTA